MCLVSAAPAAQERVVVTGCLQLGDSLVGRPAAAAREPFVLTDVKREPARPMPTDAGPLSPSAVTAAGSVAPPLLPSAVGTSDRIPPGNEGVAVYAVDGDVKGLAKRVGRRVEIIG